MQFPEKGMALRAKESKIFLQIRKGSGEQEYQFKCGLCERELVCGPGKSQTFQRHFQRGECPKLKSLYKTPLLQQPGLSARVAQGIAAATPLAGSHHNDKAGAPRSSSNSSAARRSATSAEKAKSFFRQSLHLDSSSAPADKDQPSGEDGDDDLISVLSPSRAMHQASSAEDVLESKRGSSDRPVVTFEPFQEAISHPKSTALHGIDLGTMKILISLPKQGTHSSASTRTESNSAKASSKFDNERPRRDDTLATVNAKLVAALAELQASSKDTAERQPSARQVAEALSAAGFRVEVILPSTMVGPGTIAGDGFCFYTTMYYFDLQSRLNDLNDVSESLRQEFSWFLSTPFPSTKVLLAQHYHDFAEFLQRMSDSLVAQITELSRQVTSSFDKAKSSLPALQQFQRNLSEVRKFIFDIHEGTVSFSSLPKHLWGGPNQDLIPTGFAAFPPLYLRLLLWSPNRPNRSSQFDNHYFLYVTNSLRTEDVWKLNQPESEIVSRAMSEFYCDPLILLNHMEGPGVGHFLFEPAHLHNDIFNATPGFAKELLQLYRDCLCLVYDNVARASRHDS